MCPELLECTLRDGSYVVDFKFTADDTALLVAGLEAAGVRLIEIGHGLGLNASAAGKGHAGATDEEYLAAAAQTARTARWGMFYIPGIGRPSDLEMAAEHGMHFVRIGTNATEVEQGRDAMALARKLGFQVFSNLMKSYALPPAGLAAQARLAEQMGAQSVYLVDSAGFMLPEDVRRYTQELCGALTVPVGFHGHDNLGLGVANVIAAVTGGASFVDATLQGMGRGAGNPPTELVVAVLERYGVSMAIDTSALMDLGGRIIKPLLRERGLDPLDVVAGIAGFHSSYFGLVARYAEQYHVDPRQLILAVCEVDRIEAPEALVESLARQLSDQRPPNAGSIPALPKYRGASAAMTELTAADAAASVTRRARVEAVKRNRLNVFNIVAPAKPNGRAVVSSFIQEEFSFIIASAEADDEAQLRELVGAVDGQVDYLLVDSDVKAYLSTPLSATAAEAAIHTPLLAYSDTEVWARAVVAVTLRMLAARPVRRIAVTLADAVAFKVMLALLDRGMAVTALGPEPDRRASHEIVRSLYPRDGGFESAAEVDSASRLDALLAFGRGSGCIDKASIQALNGDALVLDAGVGSLTSEALKVAHERGITVVRPDMRAAVASELELLLGTDRLVSNLMGRAEIAGVSVVGGGVIGRLGEIIVDSVRTPRRVAGVADGRGFVMSEPNAGAFRDHVRQVEEAIVRRALSGSAV